MWKEGVHNAEKVTKDNGKGNDCDGDDGKGDDGEGHDKNPG